MVALCFFLSLKNKGNIIIKGRKKNNAKGDARHCKAPL
jgi:hypothetical protein